jgi:hypothetical protein
MVSRFAPLWRGDMAWGNVDLIQVFLVSDWESLQKGVFLFRPKLCFTIQD